MKNSSNLPSEKLQPKGLKVIGAGLLKTGTYSFKTAFETLGFGPCYHVETFANNPSHVLPGKRPRNTSR